MQTQIHCTRCDWTRLISATYPEDRAADFRAGEREARAINTCPRCHDVNLDVEQLDIHGRRVRSSNPVGI